MKTYNKTYLPDCIVVGGIELKMNPLLSSAMDKSGTHKNRIAAQLRKAGIKYAFVNVLSNNLRGRTDLHGRPYQPTKWVFTDKSYEPQN